MAVIDMKNCIFRLEDAGVNYVAAKVGEGTLTYTERKQREYLMEKGIIDTVRNGDQVPMDVGFTFRWYFLRSNVTSTPSIEDALKQRYEAAAWVTTSADTCEPYAVDIVCVHTPPCAGETRERVTLPYFRYEELQHDFKAGTVSCSGKCNAQEAITDRGNQYS